MKMVPVVTDNITELLLKIVEFTDRRQKVLADNIKNIDRNGFFPTDLAVDDFSSALNLAITEHCQSNRLLLCDTESVKFGTNGSVSAEAELDHEAKGLLEDDRDQYLESQLDKLLENTLNQKIAKELLCQHQKIPL